YGNGQQEQRMAGLNPSLVIGRQAAGGNDAMDMVMAEQIGTPCVQDGEESDLGTEPLGIGGHLEQSLRAGLEQQVEERLGCGESQRVQIVGNSEDDVKVVGVEQVSLLGFEPSPVGLRLAFWT